MKWMRERDLLIAQTMAFVQSVTGKKPDADMLAAAPLAEKPASMSALAPIAAPAIATAPAETAIVAEALKAVQPEFAKLDIRGDFGSEVRARVATFRAHQERFLREREEYCSTTMAKVRAALREDTEPPRLGE